jgi:hypothetical protein
MNERANVRMRRLLTTTRSPDSCANIDETEVYLPCVRDIDRRPDGKGRKQQPAEAISSHISGKTRIKERWHPIDLGMILPAAHSPRMVLEQLCVLQRLCAHGRADLS